MAGSHVKVAISIPTTDFVRIEKARKKLRLNRSEFLVQAIRDWFEANSQSRLVEKYIQGYTTVPEEAGLVKELEKVQSSALQGDDW